MTTHTKNLSISIYLFLYIYTLNLPITEREREREREIERERPLNFKVPLSQATIRSTLAHRHTDIPILYMHTSYEKIYIQKKSFTHKLTKKNHLHTLNFLSSL